MGALDLPDEPGRRRGLLILSAAFVLAGAWHFVDPGLYLPMMPPWLPAHRELIYLSGLLEMGGGLAVLAPPLRRWAGWGLVLLLAAVFPANLHVALNPDTLPALPAWAAWARLPLQPAFMGFAWWATRKVS